MSSCGVDHRRLTKLLRRQQPVRPREPSTARIKKRVVDVACEHAEARTLADLGGVWAVDGLYALHGLDNHGLERATVIDCGLSDGVMAEARRRPTFHVMEAEFSDPETVAELGDVDVLLLFDVLLHQVVPDWDEILAMYAPSARCVGIVNPQYRGERTTRLLELGEDRYREIVPNLPRVNEFLSKLDELHPVYGRPYRDVHQIWQWGITDEDLTATMKRLGFELTYFETCRSQKWPGPFDSRGFVFLRT